MKVKYVLYEGDLLLRGKEIGVVKSSHETPYGMYYEIYWTWSEDNSQGITKVPDILLCKEFFERFTLIRSNSHENR